MQAIEEFPHLILKEVFDKIKFEQLGFLTRVPGFRKIMKAFYQIEMNQNDLVFKCVKETLDMIHHTSLVVDPNFDFLQVVEFSKVFCPKRKEVYRQFIGSLRPEELDLVKQVCIEIKEKELWNQVDYPSVFDIQEVYDILSPLVTYQRRIQLKSLCWHFCFRLDEEEDNEFLAYLENVHFKGKDRLKNLLSYVEKVIEVQKPNSTFRNALEQRLGWIETFVE